MITQHEPNTLNRIVNQNDWRYRFYAVCNGKYIYGFDSMDDARVYKEYVCAATLADVSIISFETARKKHAKPQYIENWDLDDRWDVPENIFDLRVSYKI